MIIYQPNNLITIAQTGYLDTKKTNQKLSMQRYKAANNDYLKELALINIFGHNDNNRY